MIKRLSSGPIEVLLSSISQRPLVRLILIEKGLVFKDQGRASVITVRTVYAKAGAMVDIMVN